jgi:hypothetical protein
MRKRGSGLQACNQNRLKGGSVRLECHYQSTPPNPALSLLLFFFTRVLGGATPKKGAGGIASKKKKKAKVARRLAQRGQIWTIQLIDPVPKTLRSTGVTTKAEWQLITPCRGLCRR